MEQATASDTRDDIAALSAFVDAAQRMTQSQVDAALNYLNDRYGSAHARGVLIDRIRDEFARLMEHSDLASWNRHAAARLLERAFANAVAVHRIDVAQDASK